MQTLITWLPLLLCPLMMLFCMGPMLLRRGGKCASEAEVAALAPEQVRQRLAALQREELALREQLLSVELDAGSERSSASAPDGAREGGTP